ncbi:hypothetical protein D3C87_1621750 [compost metagenome]
MTIRHHGPADVREYGGHVLEIAGTPGIVFQPHHRIGRTGEGQLELGKVVCVHGLDGRRYDPAGRRQSAAHPVGALRIGLKAGGRPAHALADDQRRSQAGKRVQDPVSRARIGAKYDLRQIWRRPVIGKAGKVYRLKPAIKGNPVPVELGWH